MGSQKDKYDLSQLSQSGKFGFETFQNQNTKTHYFHFNDADGYAAVFSQSYQTAQKRDTGLKSVLKNAGNPDRYLKSTDDNGHYFILKSGNHQQIARSRNFETVADMNNFLEIFSAIDANILIHRQELPKATPKQVEKKPRKTKMKVETKKVSEKMPRHSFRLTMYPESLSGKIVHVLSGNEKSFKGINGEAITSFIQAHLPEEVIAKQEAKASHSVKLTSKQLQLKEEINNITIKGKEQNNIAYTIQSTLPYNIEFTIKQAKKAKANEMINFHAKVFAKSLKSYQEVMVGELCTELQKDGQISIPVYFNAVPPGNYRLMTTVTLDEQQTLSGSRLVQVD